MAQPPASHTTAEPAADANAPTKTLTVRCPSCGLMHPYRTDNPYRPFCGKGCKAIDLGAWASEAYRVEAKPSSEDLPDDL
ncbi:MAG: DNA gyrase inhibitor YacG [Aquabacterium sp.]